MGSASFIMSNDKLKDKVPTPPGLPPDFNSDPAIATGRDPKTGMPYVRKVNTGFDKSDLQEQQQQEQQEQEEEQRQQQRQEQQQQQQHARKGFLNTDFDQSDLS